MPQPMLLQEFCYQDSDGNLVCCQIEAVAYGDRFVVLATELDSNTGSTITQSVEALGSALCDQLHVPPAHLDLIEHLRENVHNWGFPELFDRVTFGQVRLAEKPHFVAPCWQRITKEKAQELLMSV